MKKRGLRFISALLVATICMTSSNTIFAETEDSSEGGLFLAAAGLFLDVGSSMLDAGSCVEDWCIDRGKDLATVGMNVYDWAGDRVDDIDIAACKAGKWVVDRTGEVICAASTAGDLIVATVSNIDLSQFATIEYYHHSGEKFFLGDYSDKKPTALSLIANLAASIFNLDIGLDVRDFFYDIQNLGSEDVKPSGIVLDAIAVIPVLGSLKLLKHLDTAADTVKIISEVTDAASDSAKSLETAADVVDNVHDAAKTADMADIVTDTVKTTETIDEVKNAARVSDVVDDVSNLAKDYSKISVGELPDKVQEMYKKYEDCGWDGEKALESMSEGSSAGKDYGNWDELLPTVDSDGNELSYLEFDAYNRGEDPFRKSPKGRGTCRFVRDNLGNVYYTEDHYDTFSLVIEEIMG